MKIEFHISKKEEFEEIVSHSNGGIDSPPSKQTFEKMLKMDAYYTIKEGEQIVGSFSMLPIRNGIIMIHLLRVKQEFRKKGIGTKAVKFIEEKTKEMGRDTILSTVLEENEISQKFHEKLGFKESGNIAFDRANLIYLKDV